MRAVRRGRRFLRAALVIGLVLVVAASVGAWTMFHRAAPAVAAPRWPGEPPARICGDHAQLDGPSVAPAGAVVVPAGDDSKVELTRPATTYWFAPGVHTIGAGEYTQIAPGDRATFVGAPGAVLDGAGKNRYAFSGHAVGVTISYLTIKNFVSPINEGTVNHDSGAGWTIAHNTVTKNGGAGIFLGAGNVATDNCLSENSQYGFQGYGPKGGESTIVLDHNEIVGNNTGDWEKRVDGCGCTGGGKFWDVRDVRVTNNYVHDNRSVGLWADTDNNNFLFEDNWISDNDGPAIFWEISYNLAIRHNVIQHNLLGVGPARMRSGEPFPDAAIYLSESGGDARLPSGLVGSPTIDVSDNLVQDNYNGITLWENADRFCGSVANTSTGYCTLVNPAKVNLSTCTRATIGHEPYLSDCRWKTQNVVVHDNTFTMDPAHFFGCPPTMCGRNAIYANAGSAPSWSPYKGEGVSEAIVSQRANVFRDNTYVGPWSFTTPDAQDPVSPLMWKGPPYDQDARSTFAG